ncbi:CoA transferase [Chelativorans sp. SCAU2101]|uniref:CoA transferase n=1 Tax=Chelativorans petroleitrophicus TaxID=2975484 RepID=A0A9X3B9Q3_9HYPH|nr:CoA transferase [Chelativorans petroleitrophicus]MCT8990756.1 CoA transferase [Chelativorans petroleitrophicus]
MAQPLEGVRVADFSHVIAGPLATQFLCLLGAEVIKVEPPGGDVLRNYTQRKELRGMAEPFIGANAGKKSIILDLKTDFGREAARRLIATADIMVENFRPGVIDRLGLGYETVREINPGLIFCSISGYGQDGPMRDYPAIDQIIQSVSGLMGLSGEPDSGPMRIGFPVVDTYSALLAAFAIQAAYIQRERDPERRGQYIDMSMLDASLVMMASVVNPLVISNIEPKRTGNRGFSLAPTADTFETAENAITIGAVQQYQYERLCAALGRPDLLSDPRFADPDSRMAHDRELQAELAKTFMTKTALEWEAILSEAGVPAGAVRPVREVLKLPQLEGRNLMLEVEVPNPAISRATILNAGFRFAHDGPGVSAPPPLPGEHTDEILSELGLSCQPEEGDPA